MLLTDELAETLAEHAVGNPLVMMNLALECFHSRPFFI